MQIVRKLTIMSPFTLMGIWGVVKNDSGDKTQITTKEVLTKADTLFDQGDYKGIYELLKSYKVIKFSKLYIAYLYFHLYIQLYNIYVYVYVCVCVCNLNVTVRYLLCHIGQ